MTDEEKYYALNKNKIVETILINSKDLVYEYKYNDWKEFVNYKKDNPSILKVISFAIKIAYLEKNSAITDEERNQYKSLSLADKTNLRIILNSYFDEDLAYSIICNIEKNETEYTDNKKKY